MFRLYVMVKNVKYKSVKKKSKPLMVKEATVSVYQSGHSKVVTIPAGFPVEVGDKFRVSKKGRKKKVVLESVGDENDSELVKFLRKNRHNKNVYWTKEDDDNLEKVRKLTRKSFENLDL